MKENNLFEMNSVDLNECINGAKVELRNRNLEYRKWIDVIEKIKKEYPKVRAIFEDEKASVLSENESNMLVKIVSLYFKILKIEEQKIFFVGGREAYRYFLKMGIIEK